MTPRKIFTFIVGAAIYVGRIVRDEPDATMTAVNSIGAARVFFDEAERAGIAPTEADLD